MIARLTTPVGFWRAQVDVLAASVLLYLLVGLLSWLSGPPWAELVSLASLLLYVWPAWRLAPGHGTRLRRGLRLLGWVLLAALLGGLVAWLLVTWLPHPRAFLGAEPTVPASPGLYVVTALATLLPLFGGARLLRKVRAAARNALRWRLTLGFVLTGAATALLTFCALGLYVGSYSVVVSSPIADPQRAAERLAATLAPAQNDDARLQTELAAIIGGSARIPTVFSRSELVDGQSLDGLRRLIVVAPVGAALRVLAAAGTDAPTPGALRPADQDRFGLALQAASQQRGCVVAQPVRGTVPDSAVCPIGGGPALLIVETLAADPQAQFGALIGRVAAVTAASLVAGLGALLLIAIPVVAVGAALGYLLAGRVTRRVGQLAQATSALAAGERRLIADQRQDEIGALIANFNQMAAQLAEREAALLAERDRAERLLAANRRMVANISHELRTPLTTLRGYLEALEQSHGAQLPARDMQVIQGETERLTGLIDDLFTLSRTEARQLPLTLEPVDIAATVARLVDTIGPLARRQHAIALSADLSPGLPPACADQTRLEQVLLNLIQNALRHTPPGGIIVLEGRATPEMVCITVADTGEGIGPDDLPLVFERFYRSDASRTRATGGAGLGLALVRELTEAMGGGVTVSSTVGRGSRFTVQLPRVHR